MLVSSLPFLVSLLPYKTSMTFTVQDGGYKCIHEKCSPEILLHKENGCSATLKEGTVMRYDLIHVDESTCMGIILLIFVQTVRTHYASHTVSEEDVSLDDKTPHVFSAVRVHFTVGSYYF